MNLLNEAELKFDINFLKILKRLISNNILTPEEAKVVNKLFDKIGFDYSPLVGTNINYLKTGEIEYDRVTIKKTTKGEVTETEEILKPAKASATRFLTKLFKDLKIDVSSAIVDNIIRKIKAEYIHSDVTVNLVFGDAIKWCYLEENSLSNSCMRYKKCQEYLELYTKNPDKVGLLVLIDNGIVMARCLVWITDNEGIKYDSVYWINIEYNNIITKYLEDPEERINLLNYSDFIKNISGNINYDYINKIWSPVLEEEWESTEDDYDSEVTMNIEGLEYMPYLDSYAGVDFLNNNTIVLSADEDIDNKAWARNTDGSVNTLCQDCEGYGKTECTNCYGSQEVDCEDCDDGSIDCSYCDGNGYHDCGECDEGKVDCGECDGNSQIDCSDCEGTGIDDEDECGECGGDGKVDCSNSDCEEGKVDCEECGGKGKWDCPECIKGKVDCEECGGSGLQYCYCDDGMMQCRCYDEVLGQQESSLEGAKRVYLR